MKNVLVLISDPARPAVTAAILQAATEALRAAGATVGTPDWLAPGIACDLPFEGAVSSVTVPGVDVARLVQVQRGAAIRNLQDLTRLKRTTDPSTDLAWSLVLESMVFQAEAEVRWLDHVESSVARYRPDEHPAAPASADASAAAAAPRSAR